MGPVRLLEARHSFTMPRTSPVGSARRIGVHTVSVAVGERPNEAQFQWLPAPQGRTGSTPGARSRARQGRRATPVHTEPGTGRSGPSGAIFWLRLTNQPGGSWCARLVF